MKRIEVVGNKLIIRKDFLKDEQLLALLTALFELEAEGEIYFKETEDYIFIKPKTSHWNVVELLVYVKEIIG